MTDSQPLGPIDYVVVEFPDSEFDGGLLPALTDLIARGTVRILDLAVVVKDSDGEVEIVELEDLEDDDGRLAPYRGLAGFLTDLVTEDDLVAVADLLAPDSSAVLLVWENTWAVPFIRAVRGSRGEVVSTGRLASSDVLAALADAG
ncbi:MAG: DUF1269 domain-containing protein [Acidimicrobiales bacterium]|nr:DUF1269 domain-containing protein [Acidimicrobiales bacterium]